MTKPILVVLLMLGSVGCFPTGNSDIELEAYVRSLVDAEEIVTMDQFEQSLINIASTDAFSLTEEEQRKLTENIARKAFQLDEDRDSILIALSKKSGPMQMIAFAWSNDQGIPVLIEE